MNFQHISTARPRSQDYIDDASPALIDTGIGTDESLEFLQSSIRRAGGDVHKIARIIVTHAHTDHAGQAGRLAAMSGAEVCIHDADYPKFIGGDAETTAAHLARFESFLAFCGLSVSLCRAITENFSRRVRAWVRPISRPRILFGGETFGFDDFCLEVIHTPGHSAGCISLYNKKSGELFSGDSLLQKITPNPVAEFAGPGPLSQYRSIDRFRDSLRAIADLAPTGILPGHGPPFGNGIRRSQEVLAHFDRRKARVLELIRRYSDEKGAPGGMILKALARRMFPKLKDMELFLGLSEAYAHVQVLASEAALETRQDDGVLRFRARGDGELG